MSVAHSWSLLDLQYGHSPPAKDHHNIRRLVSNPGSPPHFLSLPLSTLVVVVHVSRMLRLLIADNGIGMDSANLRSGIKARILTPKNPTSDLGKFGMGLVTAGLSLARPDNCNYTSGSACLTSIVDMDEVIRSNTFCKYQADSTKEERDLFDREVMDSDSGTVDYF